MNIKKNKKLLSGLGVLVVIQLFVLYILDRNTYHIFFNKLKEIKRINNNFKSFKYSDKKDSNNTTFGRPIGHPAASRHRYIFYNSNPNPTYSTIAETTASFQNSDSVERNQKRIINNAITNYIQQKIDVIDDETKIRFVDCPRFATLRKKKVKSAKNDTTFNINNQSTEKINYSFEMVYKSVRNFKCIVSGNDTEEILNSFYKYIDHLIEVSEDRGLCILKNHENNFTPDISESKIYGKQRFGVLFRFYIEGFKDADYKKIPSVINLETPQNSFLTMYALNHISDTIGLIK